MKFTAEELAEMAAADAEIETGFALTNEDLRRSRALDRVSKLESMDPEKRKIAEAKRAYYEANRDKIAEAQRAYYEANRDKIAEAQRAFLRKHRHALGMNQRQYAAAIGVSQPIVSMWETGSVPINLFLVTAAFPELEEISS